VVYLLKWWRLQGGGLRAAAHTLATVRCRGNSQGKPKVLFDLQLATNLRQRFFGTFEVHCRGARNDAQ